MEAWLYTKRICGAWFRRNALVGAWFRRDLLVAAWLWGRLKHGGVALDGIHL